MSSDLIFDFGLLLRTQHALLVLAVVSLAWGARAVDQRFATAQGFAIFAAATLTALWYLPNAREFLTDGVIDSALANALSLFGVAALSRVAADAGLHDRRTSLRLVSASILLGTAALVRGELLFVFGFGLAFLATVNRVAGARRRAVGVVLAALLSSLPAAAYGCVNAAVFGHFVPLRLKAGQNLYEPIGQFPNPYGIRYDDAWIGDVLAREEIAYVSPEADAFLTGKYVDVARRDPGLLVSNFFARLEAMARFLDLPLGPVTILFALVAAGALTARDRRLAVASTPLALAAGNVVFCAWFNHMPRLVTPVHFLVQATLAAGLASGLLSLRRRMRAHLRFVRLDA